MAATTQIVPRYSFPYVETYINDYTETPSDELSSVQVDPSIRYIFAFVADKGIDNRWVLKTTQEDFVKTFGTPNFKKYGQSSLMPYMLLSSGQTKVWCMRCMPENATRSHALVHMWYKADTEETQPVASKRKFRIKFTSRFVDPTAPDAPQIITKADLQAQRFITDGEAIAGKFVDAEGYTQVPGFMMISSNGRGVGGNTFSIRVANNVYYEKEYLTKIYTFEILSADKGLIKDAEYAGSLVTSVKYDSATLINDVLQETSEGVAPVDIGVDEASIESVYDAYIAFCKQQEIDVAAEYEEKKTENSITDGMIDGTEEIPVGSEEIVHELRDLQTMILRCADDILPTLETFDPIHGLALGETSEMQQFIYFTQKMTDDVDTDADDYDENDYTESEIIDLDDVRGVRLNGGTNGYFEDPRTVTEYDKEGRPHQVKWTVQQEYDNAYNNAWNGTFDKRILTAKRIFAHAIFDANYNYEVKCTIAALAQNRNDAIFYMDTGIRASFGDLELNEMIKQYSNFANRLVSKNVHHFYTRDPITKKRIPVTITYFLADAYWKHRMNNGIHIPFVKTNCQLTGHIKNSLTPTVEDYEIELKECLVENNFNYFETVEDNVYQRATQNTSQTILTDLTEESNVTILYEAKRIIEKDINDSLYDFNEADVRTRFREYEIEKFRDWNSKYVESIDIQFKANRWELERSILHCYVSIVFRGIYKRAIVEIDINRRSYADADE